MKSNVHLPEPSGPPPGVEPVVFHAHLYENFFQLGLTLVRASSADEVFGELVKVCAEARRTPHGEDTPCGRP